VHALIGVLALVILYAPKLIHRTRVHFRTPAAA
jgi:hypothetical protein